MKGKVMQCGGRQWLLFRAELLDEADVELVCEGDQLMICPMKPSLREALTRFTWVGWD